jgi:acetoin utilization protein AcuC
LDPGAGDDAIRYAVDEIFELANKIQPDVVLLATGADAHRTDPLSSLNFDFPGYEHAARTAGQIASTYASGRILIGGAGGYQPFGYTPQIWATVVSKVYDEVRLFSWA